MTRIGNAKLFAAKITFSSFPSAVAIASEQQKCFSSAHRTSTTHDRARLQRSAKTKNILRAANGTAYWRAV